MERNPYFWWVDTEGRQLPYIDRVTFELVTDREVINLKASAGELGLPVPPPEPDQLHPVQGERGTGAATAP